MDSRAVDVLISVVYWVDIWLVGGLVLAEGEG